MQYRQSPPNSVLKSECLPECRMEMLGLDPGELDRTEPDALMDILRNCAGCDMREPCAADLQRDPNNPVWESYCPNAQQMLQLVRNQWARA